MSSRYSDEDEDEDDDDDVVEEWDRDDDDETYPCPYCGEAVYEDAEWCPHCEKYLSDEDAPAATKPWWIIAGVLAILATMYWWSFAR